MKLIFLSTTRQQSVGHYRCFDRILLNGLIQPFRLISLEDVKPHSRSFLSCADSRLNLLDWASLASISACKISSKQAAESARPHALGLFRKRFVDPTSIPRRCFVCWIA